MLRYSLILLLVNIYGRSLGGPVPEQNNNGKTSIANLLSDLTKQCKNKFVLGQIVSKSSSCDVELNYRVPDLQCLMFYDANRLLCNTSANLETEFITNISEKQNFSAFCKDVSHLTVPSTRYQKMINTVLQNEDTCKKVCADDDISTGDTNFFCKYYMWTLLKLQLPQNSQQQHAPTSTAISDGASSVQAIHSTDGQDKIPSDTAASSKPQTGKAEETNQHTSELVKHESSSTAQLVDAQNPESDSPSSVDSTVKKTTQQPALESDKNILDTDKTAEDKKEQLSPILDPNGVGNAAGHENNAGNKDPDVSIPQIETPGQKAGLENVNGDGDDSGNENDDVDEDAKDLTDDEDLNSNDVQGKFDQEVVNPDKLENQGSQNAEVSQREFFQTTDGFTEDDDHFFPFFLTAVIVVVVLYILYHNKNKVGKMFFGLIVEGRQPGRRRTSRGHAYRRLDTLEQAMSANATAPPSKIIY